MEMVGKKAICLALLCMVAIAAAPGAEALTCSQVSGALRACIPYLTSNVALPPACCGGVKSLVSQAKTTPDRQTACTCLKAAAKALPINPSKAAGLPGQCGANIPYKISPSTDCSQVR
ncbi:hypothetical protein M9H77_22462 [Catharanthus roseus]|uniref:Uncharacterized protein n=1 Tax=Catharanthus roseus TaxID=4058 RepID=A0ACC0ARH6_CATRO|nr:hypothetical protein M9H77_22462 [Catharanthus roseus]